MWKLLVLKIQLHQVTFIWVYWTLLRYMTFTSVAIPRPNLVSNIVIVCSSFIRTSVDWKSKCSEEMIRCIPCCERTNMCCFYLTFGGRTPGLCQHANWVISWNLPGATAIASGKTYRVPLMFLQVKIYRVPRLMTCYFCFQAGTLSPVHPSGQIAWKTDLLSFQFVSPFEYLTRTSAVGVSF